MSEIKQATINTKNLDNILKSIKKFISKDENKPIYNNIKIECSKEKIKMIACDGYRLAINECYTSESETFECIIPVFSIPKNAEEFTTIILENEDITIDFGIYKITYKTIKKEFVNYEDMIKTKEDNFKIAFNAKLLKEALESFNKEIVELEFNISNNICPVIITNIKNKQNKVVVLPYKLREECNSDE